VLPYWILFGVYALGSLQGTEGLNSARRRDAMLLLAAFVTILFVGLRYRVGGDWANYFEIYEELGALSLPEALASTRSDFSYSLINWISYHLGTGMWLVNLICAAVLIWGVVRFASSQLSPWLVVLVAIPYLIIVVGLGYTRQAAAIGLELVAITALLSGSTARFLIYAVLAVTFHKSAVVIIPLGALATVTRNRVGAAIVVGGITVLLYYFFVSGRIETMSTNYETLESQGAGVRVLMNIVPGALFLLFRRRFVLSEQEARLWRNMALAALASGAALLLTSSSTAVDRLALYLIPVQLFVLGRLPVAFSGNRRPLPGYVLAVIAYSAVIQFVWLVYAQNAYAWIPYRNYLFETSDTM
jgi:hypothetical protein